MESFDTLFEADAHVMSTVVDTPVISTVVDAPVVDIVQPSAQPETELGSLVHDFVADFQLLAAQLQDFNADPAC